MALFITESESEVLIRYHKLLQFIASKEENYEEADKHKRRIEYIHESQIYYKEKNP